MSTVIAYSTATNPGAGAAVVTTGSVGGGKYTVVVTTNPTGTIAAGDLNNVQLQVGATVIGRLLMPATAGTVTASPPIVVDVPQAGAAISVNAVGAASGASAVYGAQIVATVP